MKITIYENKIIFLGKGREIASHLKIYANRYERVVDWIDDQKKHPLLIHKNNAETIETAFAAWENFVNEQVQQMKANEEQLNRLFIDMYGLEGELVAEVDEADVTLYKADKERDVKSFISYAVGCMFGRYSLDEEGLMFAGGTFDASRYQTFPTDKDNILPILSGAYFEDDIVARFVEFVRVIFGEEMLDDNLHYIAEAIGRRKNETAQEAIRRYFLTDFFKDHVRIYKKRPIYWLFTSGREKAFNCLVYMHRYDQTTLSRIRTDYLHPFQTRLEVEKRELLEVIDSGAAAKEINAAKRQLTLVDKKIAELSSFDERLHHMADMQIDINLDDGVRTNADKFKGLLAKF